MHLFISLLLRGSIISKCYLKMCGKGQGKVREFDRDWRVVTLSIVRTQSCGIRMKCRSTISTFDSELEMKCLLCTI